MSEKKKDSCTGLDINSLKRELRLKDAELSLLKDENKALKEKLKKSGSSIKEQAPLTSGTIAGFVLKNAADWIFVKNRQLEFVLVSSAVCKAIGVDEKKLLGRQEYDFFPAEADLLKSIDQQVLAGHLAEAEIHKIINREERVFHCLRVPVFSEDGQVDFICAISRDITEHRKIEHDYQHLFQKMRDGFAVHEIIFDQDGNAFDYRFIDVNPAFEKITGLSRDQLLGKSVLELMPETEKIWIERYARVAKTGISESFEEFSISLKKHFEVTAFRPAHGQFACICRDITEKIKEKKEKEKMEIEAAQSQKMESIGRLAGGVAHDFNNLIGIILGCVEMAIMKKKRGASIDTELEGIKTTAERSADLTRQLLAFARRQPIAPTNIDLSETVNGMLNMLRRLIGERIEIVFDPAREKMPIKFDIGQLNQVLANLCINARDAISGSGKIFISIGREKVDLEGAGVDGIPPGKYIFLKIEDTGIGIEEGALQHIFEPFYTTKKSAKGTGLGLATVYGIVSQNEGYIRVSSRKDSGTTFKILIPEGKPEIDKVKIEVAENDEMTGTGRILAVEDDENILDLIKKVLENFGYKVVTSTKPVEILKTVSDTKQKFDLLITDVVLPGMNGRELSESMQKLQPDLKILFISGYTADIISTHGLDSAKNFLQKPFHISGLAKAVKKALAKE